MARYILCNRVVFQGIELKSAKVIDDQVYDVARLAAAGAILVLTPNAAVEARAADVRSQQARGRRGDELDDLTAASAESADLSGLPLATHTTPGLMSAPDKTTLDALGFGIVLIQVRNESGSTILKGQLAAAVGYSVPLSLTLVNLADKDVGALRPAIGMVQHDIPNNSTGFVVSSGLVTGLDTSMFSLTDQLVLGNAGAYSRPPPDQDPFTGEVQNVGSVSRVHATLGEIAVAVDGLLPFPAEQIFALSGVAGHAFPFSAVQGALAVATANVSLNNRKAVNVLDPTAPQDAATKAYVDAVATGLVVKAAARVISTTLIVLSGAQTIDGVGVVAGDRVLVAGQGGNVLTPSVGNGLYVAAVGAWARTTDMASGSSASGSFVFVTSGTTFGSTGWVCSTPAGSAVVGTNPIAFSQFSGVGTINAGAGLTKTGNTIDVVANADGSIVVNPDDVQVGVLATDAQHGNRGGGAQHPVVTVSVAGFMSSADKTKLDGVAVGATSTPLSSTAPTTVHPGDAAAVGVGTTAARADHAHAATSAAAGPINVGDSAADGTSTSFSRADHVHSLAAPGAPTSLSSGDAAAAGTSTSPARADHVHGVPAPAAPVNVTKAAASAGAATTFARGDHKHDVSTAAPGVISVGDAAAEGTASTVARSDHTHSLAAPAAPTTINSGDAAAAGTSTSPARADHVHAVTAPAAPVNVTKAAAAAGTATTLARSDHKHDATTAAPAAAGVSTASAEGTATSLARSDHSHQSNTAPADVTKAAASVGTSGEPARADHKHDVSTAVVGAVTIGASAAEGTATSIARSDHVHTLAAPASPQTVGTANTAGTSTSPARADHVHSHGAQTDGTLHAAATTSTAGFLSAVDKTKLDAYADETVEVACRPELDSIGAQTTRVCQTTFEGASYYTPKRISGITRIIVRNTAVTSPGVAEVAIYQRPGGLGGGSPALVASGSFTPAGAGNNTITVTSFSLDPGVYYVLFGRSSATGSVTMRVHAGGSFDLLTANVDANTHPAVFTTTISAASAPPATINALTDLTASTSDLIPITRLRA